MKINILLSADDTHAPYAAAVIRSVVTSAGVDDELEIYILTLGFSVTNKQKFNLMGIALGVEIHLVVAAPSLIEGLPIRGSMRVAYLRMFAGILLPTVDVAVYLDTDILVRCSLSELLVGFKNSDCFAIAVRDKAVITAWKGLNREVPSNFAKDHYFNSGVMVLDLVHLRRTRADSVLPKIRSALIHSILHDQSALNVFFEEDIELFGEEYNYMLDAYDSLVVQDPVKYRFLVGAFLDPKIVHFAGFKKPWQRRFPQRFASEYRQHLINTPWGKSARQKLTLRQEVGRAVRIFSYFRILILYRRIWLIRKLIG